MSKRSKKGKQFQSVPPPASANPTGNLDFDTMEDKIRGEEILLKEDLQKAKTARDLKKKMDDQEVDRRLKELRKQLGLKK